MCLFCKVYPKKQDSIPKLRESLGLLREGAKGLSEWVEFKLSRLKSLNIIVLTFPLNRIMTMIKRLFLLAFLTMLLARPCLAQKEKESYKKSLSSRTSAEQLVNEAQALKIANPDAALDKVQQALAVCVAQGDNFNEGRSYILLAEVNEGIL